ncbi:MAG TPA: hypothetical protein VIY48_04440 [Candidatus Paceibacterota bacterium]
MIETLLTLFGGGLGGLLRFVPEIIKFFGDKQDREHEYRMTQLQLDIDKARSEQAIDLVHANGDMAQAAGEMQAYIEAIKGQSVRSGVKWLDGLNQSVRPVVTYWWMSLFTVYKIATIYAAYLVWTTLDDFIAKLWTTQDAGVLSMILGFWFVDRAIRNQK